MSFHKIVVALDDSVLSKSVFTQAIALAKTAQASLLLFSGISNELMAQPAMLPAEIGVFTGDLMSSNYQAQYAAIEQQTAAMQGVLQKYYDAAKAAELAVETTFKVGDVESLLCEVAEAWGADLIVVGRRGRTGLSEALLGSVSNYAVHHAHCSVLVVQGEVEPETSEL